jgi:hypothetical protein
MIHCGMARMAVSEMKFRTLVAMFCASTLIRQLRPSKKGFQTASRGQHRKISVNVVMT